MKIQLMFLLLAVVGQCTYADYVHHSQNNIAQKHVERIFGDKIKAGLEKLKKFMVTGNDSVGIPKLDPFESDYEEIIVDEEVLNGEGKFNNIHVEGLSNFTVQNADYEFFASNVVLDLAWPNIKGNTLYDIQVNVLDKYPVYGSGKVSFELQNFNFATKVKVSIDFKNKKVSIISFSNTKISLKKLKFEITGLYNDETISQEIGPVISMMAPEILIDFQEEITQQVNKMMVPLGNKMLEEIDISKFMNI